MRGFAESHLWDDKLYDMTTYNKMYIFSTDKLHGFVLTAEYGCAKLIVEYSDILDSLLNIHKRSFCTGIYTANR